MTRRPLTGAIDTAKVMSVVISGSLPSVTALALATLTAETASSSSVMVMAAPATVTEVSPVTAPVTEISSSSSSRLSSVGVSPKLASAASAPAGRVTVTAPTVP